MARKIIGRKREILQLENIAKSDKAELVAVYGRRRIGKTYLVKEFFNEKFDYYATVPRVPRHCPKPTRQHLHVQV